MNRKGVILAGAGAAAFAGLSLWNYDRFMGHPLKLGETTYKIIKKPFSCTRDGITLKGEILLPDGKTGRLPTVIMCHGYGSSYKLCKKLAGITLAQSGFACVVFDFFGGSRHSISGGSMTDMSVFTEKADLDAVTDAVLKMDFADTDRLFLFGESHGGLVSAVTADSRDVYSALVLYYPAFTMAYDASRAFKRTEDIPDEAKFGVTVKGRKYFEDIMGWNVYEHIAGYKKDVLIIHGDADSVIDVSCAYKAKELYENAQLHILPGQPHGFDGRGKMEAARLTYSFLKNHI